MVLCNCEFYRWDGKHVMEGLNRCGAKSATNLPYGNILSNLEDSDYGFQGTVGPHREAV